MYGKVLHQQPRHHGADLRRHKLRLDLLHIVAILDRINDGRIRRRPADSPLLQHLHQAGFVVARRRLRKLLLADRASPAAAPRRRSTPAACVSIRLRPQPLRLPPLRLPASSSCAASAFDACSFAASRARLSSSSNFRNAVELQHAARHAEVIRVAPPSPRCPPSSGRRPPASSGSTRTAARSACTAGTARRSDTAESTPA